MIIIPEPNHVETEGDEIWDKIQQGLKIFKGNNFESTYLPMRFMGGGIGVISFTVKILELHMKNGHVYKRIQNFVDLGYGNSTGYVKFEQIAGDTAIPTTVSKEQILKLVLK